MDFSPSTDASMPSRQQPRDSGRNMPSLFAGDSIDIEDNAQHRAEDAHTAQLFREGYDMQNAVDMLNLLRYGTMFADTSATATYQHQDSAQQTLSQRRQPRIGKLCPKLHQMQSSRLYESKYFTETPSAITKRSTERVDERNGMSSKRKRPSATAVSSSVVASSNKSVNDTRFSRAKTGIDAARKKISTTNEEHRRSSSTNSSRSSRQRLPAQRQHRSSQRNPDRISDTDESDRDEYDDAYDNAMNDDYMINADPRRDRRKKN
ncbi:hypothetical protein EAI_01957 [Harpegnathos saltator]|uniref:Uncharacterized protein n=1 Tax=Harpegnathos saltator TaxID=610380 RepID=E2BWM6_HARSA|nr:hypothetical protein EAI_01957 [Harpegnathos saltator]